MSLRNTPKHENAVEIDLWSIRPARDKGRQSLVLRARKRVWPGHRSEPQIV